MARGTGSVEPGVQSTACGVPSTEYGGAALHSTNYRGFCRPASRLSKSTVSNTAWLECFISCSRGPDQSQAGADNPGRERIETVGRRARKLLNQHLSHGRVVLEHGHPNTEEPMPGRRSGNLLNGKHHSGWSADRSCYPVQSTRSPCAVLLGRWQPISRSSPFRNSLACPSRFSASVCLAISWCRGVSPALTAILPSIV